MNEQLPLVAALFVRRNSIYKAMPAVECYDEARDARTFKGGMPVIAHPPCRLWGTMAHMSTADPAEKELATWSVDVVRREGGVLEHPKRSRLFHHPNFKLPGQVDAFGGFLLPIVQFWWGHKADKATMLYIVGVSPEAIPPIPLQLGEAPSVCSNSRRRRAPSVPWRPEISKAERECTPPALAQWLVDVARLTVKS